MPRSAGLDIRLNIHFPLLLTPKEVVMIIAVHPAPILGATGTGLPAL